MKFIILIIFSIFSFSTTAKDFNNGCGSGWNEKFVPDRISLLGIDFSQSCSNHDNCYSKCLEDGENFNKPICELSAIEQKEGRRQICDFTFLSEMNKSCDKIDSLRKTICLGTSALYAIAVRKGGGGSFDGMEVPSEYFDFIESEKAKGFDFSNFVIEVNQIQNIGEVSKSNKLVFTVEKNYPLVKFVGFESGAKPTVEMNGKLFQTNSLLYGGADLTNAYNKSLPLTIENIDVRNLNLDKLKIEQHFSITQP